MRLELLHSKKSATEKWYVTNVACSFLQSHYTVHTVLFISVVLLNSKARKGTEVKLSYVETFQSNHAIKAIFATKTKHKVTGKKGKVLSFRKAETLSGSRHLMSEICDLK